MADIVMEGFSSNDVPLDVLISQQQTLAKEHGRELTEEEAFEEVIANALEGVMADGKVAQFLQQLEGRDKSLGARVRRFFNDIAQLIRDTLDAYAGVMPDSVEGIMISQMEDTYKQLQKALAEGIYQAGETFRQAEKNSTGDGGVRYKLSATASADVKKALSDKNYSHEVKLTDVSPSILLSPKGVRNLPMMMVASHIRENVFTEAEAKAKGLRVGPNINYHGLGETLFLKVIDGLDEVTEAYRGHLKQMILAEGKSIFF